MAAMYGYTHVYTHRHRYTPDELRALSTEVPSDNWPIGRGADWPSAEAEGQSAEAEEPSADAEGPSAEADEPSAEAEGPSAEADEPSGKAKKPSGKAKKPSGKAASGKGPKKLPTLSTETLYPISDLPCKHDSPSPLPHSVCSL